MPMQTPWPAVQQWSLLKTILMEFLIWSYLTAMPCKSVRQRFTALLTLGVCSQAPLVSVIFLRLHFHNEWIFSKTFYKQNSPASEGKLNFQKKKLISEKEDWDSACQIETQGTIWGSDSDIKIWNIMAAEEMSFHKGILLISNLISLPKGKKKQYPCNRKWLLYSQIFRG